MISQFGYYLLSCVKAMLLAAAFLGGTLHAQVTIREKVDVGVGGDTSSGNVIGTKVPPRSSLDLGQPTIFLQCGGPLTLQMNVGFYQILLLPSMEVLVQNPAAGVNYNIGTFAAGSSIQFGYTMSEWNPDVYPLTTNQDMVGGYQTGAPFFYGTYFFAFSLNLDIGDSSSCLDIRPQTGPPRQPAPIVAETDTHLTAFFFRRSTAYPRDSLWFYTTSGGKKDSLYLDSTAAWRSTIFDLGNVRAGDSINFGLKSSVEATRGEFVYPKLTWHPATPPDPSPDDRWNINFERWIDTDFSEYKGFLLRNPPRYVITFDKDAASPGDTISFHVGVNGVPDESSIEAEMDVNIIQGRENAFLMDTAGVVYGQDLPSYWSYSRIKDGLEIVVSDSLPPATKIIVQVVSEWDWMYSGRAELPTESTILLGETKYYQAKNDPSGRLIIEEHMTPQAQILADPIDTVTIVTGNKLGVYYEKRDSTGDGLPPDQIRLVGRYWSPDSTYRVKLTATEGGRTASVVIRVDKPDLLGSTIHRIHDVENNEINIDSIVMNYAGRQGIPPQVIMGQIRTESAFDATMRYEPFTDASLQKGGSIDSAFRYWISNADNLGIPPSPTNHRFRLYGDWSTQYPGFIGSIYQAWNAQRGSYPHILYPSVHSAWTKQLYIPAWRAARKANRTVDSLALVAIATSSAEAEWPVYLRDKFRGGLANMTAQTRIVASYGFLQSLYYYATTMSDYRVDEYHLPETLMETDTSLTYATNHLKLQFPLAHVGERFENPTGWQEGYDGTFRRALNRYNGWYDRNPYPDSVFSNSRLYLPRRGN